MNFFVGKTMIYKTVAGVILIAAPLLVMAIQAVLPSSRDKTPHPVAEIEQPLQQARPAYVAPPAPVEAQPSRVDQQLQPSTAGFAPVVAASPEEEDEGPLITPGR